MTITMGTDEGYAEPGVLGATNPFPYENLQAPIYKRLAENRLAGLNNRTLDTQLSQNDVLAAHRGVYTSRQFPRNPRVLVAFHPGAGQAYSAGGVPSNARGATTTIQDGTGKNVNSPGDLSRIGMLAMSSAAGLVNVDGGSGRNNEVFANWLTLADTDLGAGTQYVARVTDANNWIGLSRQSATNIRVTRNVAGTPATERDITIASTTPASGNAFGLRLSGTSAQVFLNGVKLDDWTLNAAAQGLTGTRVGVVIAAGAHVYNPISYFELWSLTAVNGV